MDWRIGLEMILLLPLIISYGGLIEHIIEYKKLDIETRHMFHFGVKIKWWWYFPFGYLFNKENYN